MPNKLTSQFSVAVCPHVIYEKLASCHIALGLVLLLQSFLPFPSNASSPSSSFPEKMTGFLAQWQGEIEQETELGFPLPAPSQAVQGIQNMRAAQSLTSACPLLFDEKEVKQHTIVVFSLLAGHRRTAHAGEGVIFLSVHLHHSKSRSLPVIPYSAIISQFCFGRPLLLRDLALAGPLAGYPALFLIY